METEHTTTTETPKPKRKPAKKRAKPARKVTYIDAVVMDPPLLGAKLFDGITPADCPMACTAERCVISGRGICSHPHKGGLQANLQNPDSLRRYNAAKRALGKRKLDLRDDE